MEDNVKGATAAFCTFSPFKSGWARRWHWVVQKAAPRATQQVRLRRFLHYAYFVALSPRDLARANIPAKAALRPGALLFLSAYNGTAEVYFRGFSEKLPDQMNDLWGGCTDWENAGKYENLDRFITTYRRPVGFHFNAYPDKSVNVRAALKLRLQLDELLAATHGDAREFSRRYRRAAQSIWGKPLGEGAL